MLNENTTQRPSESLEEWAERTYAYRRSYLMRQYEQREALMAASLRAEARGERLPDFRPPPTSVPRLTAAKQEEPDHVSIAFAFWVGVIVGLVAAGVAAWSVS